MNPQDSQSFNERYQKALTDYLEKSESLVIAEKLGRQALEEGLGILEIVNIHVHALIALSPHAFALTEADSKSVRAGPFLRLFIAELTMSPRRSSPTKKVKAITKRLERETARRQKAEVALRESQKEYKQLLRKSTQYQNHLHHLSQQILQAQEDERKHISRELHDEISQILTGINVRLATLSLDASTNTGNFKKKIDSTQRLVAKSVKIVHRFARELRPAMLDDLGLIPALITYMKDLGKRTGLQIQFSSIAPEEIKELESMQRTVLYRIVQEALINICRHARATSVKILLTLEKSVIHLEIADNGKGFDIKRLLGNRRQKRLGILGMRERAEMVNGSFIIESTLRVGTTIRVQVPLTSSTDP